MLTIEILAALFGAASVYFYIVRNHWSWPVGLVQVVLYVAVFAQAKLYADMLLHVVYAGLQLYGWWAWLDFDKSTKQPFPTDRTASLENASEKQQNISIRRLPVMGLAITFVAIAIMTSLYAFLLSRYTDASLPILDSLIAAMSLVAQLLLAWRFLENWIFWIAVDLLAIGVFAYKTLYPTTILYAIFLVMAMLGWRAWRTAWLNQLHAKPSNPTDLGLVQ